MRGEGPETGHNSRLLPATKNTDRISANAGPRTPVLLYHHVGPPRPGIDRKLTMSPQRFEQQMRWLARRGYVGLRPSDWSRWIRGERGLPENPILLTFDDAYADTADYALPILREYGLSGAVFVVTERLGATNAWDEARGCVTLQLMTAEQIQYWAGQGIEFGAHSRTHADLTHLPSAECWEEIVGSKNDLAALLGNPVVSFAYPYGKYNDAVRDLVGREFDLAFSVEEGMNDLRGDPHLIRRTLVCANDSLLRFALMVRSGLSVDGWRIKFRVRTRLKRLLRHFSFRRTPNPA
jgi:peptidoglycan/xylan/chitin deacetylase (PgdA/CDA1 family)